uniref:Lateral signaling target protein 2 homolog n=1 Tax=Saccoglossus kowalevskii TaxID=10224 RepID=A0ABM0M7H7_SACKO|nr:PREDICTED: lateral signaling target protein 2 homolog [Saccoglossus kowalevskii]
MLGETADSTSQSGEGQTSTEVHRLDSDFRMSEPSCSAATNLEQDLYPALMASQPIGTDRFHLPSSSNNSDVLTDDTDDYITDNRNTGLLTDEVPRYPSDEDEIDVVSLDADSQSTTINGQDYFPDFEHVVEGAVDLSKFEKRAEKVAEEKVNNSPNKPDSTIKVKNSDTKQKRNRMNKSPSEHLQNREAASTSLNSTNENPNLESVPTNQQNFFPNGLGEDLLLHPSQADHEQEVLDLSLPNSERTLNNELNSGVHHPVPGLMGFHDPLLSGSEENHLAPSLGMAKTAFRPTCAYLQQQRAMLPMHPHQSRSFNLERTELNISESSAFRRPSPTLVSSSSHTNPSVTTNNTSQVVSAGRGFHDDVVNVMPSTSGLNNPSHDFNQTMHDPLDWLMPSDTSDEDSDIDIVSVSEPDSQSFLGFIPTSSGVASGAMCTSTTNSVDATPVEIIDDDEPVAGPSRERRHLFDQLMEFDITSSSSDSDSNTDVEVVAIDADEDTDEDVLDDDDDDDIISRRSKYVKLEPGSQQSSGVCSSKSSRIRNRRRAVDVVDLTVSDEESQPSTSQGSVVHAQTSTQTEPTQSTTQQQCQHQQINGLHLDCPGHHHHHAAAAAGAADAMPSTSASSNCCQRGTCISATCGSYIPPSSGPQTTATVNGHPVLAHESTGNTSVCVTLDNNNMMSCAVEARRRQHHHHNHHHHRPLRQPHQRQQHGVNQRHPSRQHQHRHNQTGLNSQTDLPLCKL